MNQFKFIVCLWCVRVDYASDLEQEQQNCMHTLGLTINVHCHLSKFWCIFVQNCLNFENWIHVDETIIILNRFTISQNNLTTRNRH